MLATVARARRRLSTAGLLPERQRACAATLPAQATLLRPSRLAGISVFFLPAHTVLAARKFFVSCPYVVRMRLRYF